MWLSKYSVSAGSFACASEPLTRRARHTKGFRVFSILNTTGCGLTFIPDFLDNPLEDTDALSGVWYDSFVGVMAHVDFAVDNEGVSLGYWIDKWRSLLLSRCPADPLDYGMALTFGPISSWLDQHGV